jgi:hypothetical protein
MRKIILAISILGLGAVVWFFSTYSPWWRIKVFSATAGIKIKISKIKLAYVMSKLGFWSKGIRYSSESFAAPKQVLVFFNNNQYERDRFVDRESQRVLYSVENEFDENTRTLTVFVGLKNKKDQGEFKMVNMINSNLLMTLMRMTKPVVMDIEEFNREVVRFYKGINPYWRQFVSYYEEL